MGGDFLSSGLLKCMARGRKRFPKPAPGQGTILRRSKRRKKGGKRLRNSMSVTFTVIDDLVYDLNAVKLIEFVSMKLAEHHRDSTLKGQHPSGKPAAPLDADSLNGKYGPREGTGGTFFHNTGNSARAWLLGDITGTSVRAKRILKPNIISHDGQNRDWLVNAWLKRGIDLQSIEGKAASVIGAAVDEYIEGNLGSTLTAPPTESRAGGRLSRLPKRFG